MRLFKNRLIKWVAGVVGPMLLHVKISCKRKILSSHSIEVTIDRDLWKRI